jgi:stage III sporulation protein AH
MKRFKRNAVIVTVLVFVAVAVYLNWSYGKEDDLDVDVQSGAEEGTEILTEGDGTGESGDIGNAGLYYGEDGVSAQALPEEIAGQFDEMRFERSRARDSAEAALLTVTEVEGASQTTIDEALSKITQMAEWIVLETEIETLIKAKGFSECVVYISSEGVTVTVTPQTMEGLSTAAVARITDIVTEKTQFTAKDLNIVEIK